MCEVDSTLCARSNIYWLKVMCNGADKLSADRSVLAYFCVHVKDVVWNVCFHTLPI